MSQSTPIDDAAEWLSFAEELGRKGLESLQKWTDRFETGQVTKRELYIVTHVLCDVMMGLAKREDMDIVVAVNEAIRQEAKRKRS